jgi:hypothetical protein
MERQRAVGDRQEALRSHEVKSHVLHAGRLSGDLGRLCGRGRTTTG